MISYLAPLPGEERKPGMTWWFPPLSPSPFSGPSARVRPIVDALNRGGCPAKEVIDVRSSMAFASAIFMPVIAALELANWSFTTMRKTDSLNLAARGGWQASALAAPGQKRWLARIICQPVTLSIWWIAPLLIPFDLETYLKVHFTKVGIKPEMLDCTASGQHLPMRLMRCPICLTAWVRPVRVERAHRPLKGRVESHIGWRSGQANVP